MQQMDRQTALELMERREVDRIVQTFAAPGCPAENLAQVAHDARNMVTALDLYCDLLQEPGVLAAPFSHYAGELKHVATTSRLLVERLAKLDSPDPDARASAPDEKSAAIHGAMQRILPNGERRRSTIGIPIDNLAAEVLANRNLLAALAGPHVAVTVDVEGSALPVELAGENLTRILVNLVKNAAEAMSFVGRIHISVWESAGDHYGASWLTLNVEDNGPGFSEKNLSKTFQAGGNPRTDPSAVNAGWPFPHRGLGLSITRSIVERAGGRFHAANRDPVGACIQIELPVRKPGEGEPPTQAQGNLASFN
jgi:signal transduction histidine kinase